MPTKIRAAALIDAFGADTARWPADERGAALAAIAADPALTARLAEAQALDAGLAAWAAAPVPRARSFADDLPALLPAPIVAARPRPLWRGFALGGGAVAASLAVALVFGLPASGPAPVAAPAPQIAAVAPTDADAAMQAPEGFALIFTPTADEEDLI